MKPGRILWTMGLAGMVIISGVGTGCSNHFVPKSAPPLSTWYHSYYLSPNSNIRHQAGYFVSEACHLGCSYRIKSQVPLPGYDQMEVFLNGWEVQNLGGPTTVKRLSIGMDSVTYDPISGDYSWDVVAEVQSGTRSGDEFKFIIFYTHLLTNAKGAKMLPFTQGCSSASGGICSKTGNVLNTIPAGWEVPVVGIKRINLEVGVQNPGIKVNRIGMDIRGWSQAGSNLSTPFSCAIHDSSPTESMGCSMEAVVLTAAPGETHRFLFNGSRTSSVAFHQSTLVPHSGPPAYGSFGGLEAFSLAFTKQHEAKIWSWMAGYRGMGNTSPPLRFHYWEFGQLGDNFNSPINAALFDLELAGFGIWTP